MSEDPEDTCPDEEEQEDSGPVSQPEMISVMLRYLGAHGHTTINQRQLNAVIRGCDEILIELEKPHLSAQPGSGVVAWMQSDDTGQSSRYMLTVLMRAAGNPHFCGGHKGNQYPHDPNDFARCVGMLNAVPELRQHIAEMANHGPVWAGYAAVWDELEALHRQEEPSGKAPMLYERMQAIQRQVQGDEGSEPA